MRVPGNLNKKILRKSCFTIEKKSTTDLIMLEEERQLEAVS